MNTTELLKLLVCPICHGKLELKEEESKPCGFYCAACELVYPIRDEIPVMLVDEAIPMAKWQAGER